MPAVQPINPSRRFYIHCSEEYWDVKKAFINYGRPLHLDKWDRELLKIPRVMAFNDVLTHVYETIMKITGFPCPIVEVSANSDRIFIRGDAFCVEYVAANAMRGD